MIAKIQLIPDERQRDENNPQLTLKHDSITQTNLLSIGI